MESGDIHEVLVAGATGYVGGRLVPLLLERGYRVRAMARTPEKLRCRPWSTHPNLAVVSANVMDRESLVKAASGCTAVFYLVHSMSSSSGDFVEQDRTAAENMVVAAEKGRCGKDYLSGRTR